MGSGIALCIWSGFAHGKGDSGMGAYDMAFWELEGAFKENGEWGSMGG